jgi:Ca2+-dependent lipid-binding protein
MTTIRNCPPEPHRGPPYPDSNSNTSDPYVKIKVTGGGTTKHKDAKTNPHKGTLNPVSTSVLTTCIGINLTSDY